jgi:uncharacterized Zn-binding protein involved in type VI secretion
MATQESVHGHPVAAGDWRSRLGLRAQVAAGVVLMLAVGIFAGNAYLSQQYGPEGAARHYFAAVQKGDASGAFADLEVGSPSSRTDAKLVDQTAMAAALRTGRPSFPALDVGNATISGTVAILTASFQATGGRKQLSLTLERANGDRQLGVYPRWRIAVLPGVLKVAVPSGSSGIQVDGATVALPGGQTSTVAVLPMPHQVTLPATGLMQGQSAAIDATFANPDGWTVTFTPKLTASGQTKASAAINELFKTCAASTSSTPNGCPQSYDTQSKVQWQLIGDPVAGLTFGNDKQGQASASGHYLFTFAFATSSGATAHGIAGNGYTAGVGVTSTDIRVATIADDNNVPAVARPGPATDQAAKDLVQKGFAACAAATDAAPVDCPQTKLSARNASKNVRWTLDGDPLAGANTSWDGNLDALIMKGTFSMAIEYDSTDPVGGHYRDRSDTKQYTAGLIVDSGVLRLIFIRGDF